MQVFTHFAGSECVVYQRTDIPHYNARYIDARIDSASPLLRSIELVHQGRVKATYRVYLHEAPAKIIALMRNGFNPLEGGA